MRATLISRIIGAVILGIIGVFTSLPIYNFVQQFVEMPNLSQGVVTGFTVAIFTAFGFLITPYITIKPFQALIKMFNKIEDVATPNNTVIGTGNGFNTKPTIVAK